MTGYLIFGTSIAAFHGWLKWRHVVKAKFLEWRHHGSE